MEGKRALLYAFNINSFGMKRKIYITISVFILLCVAAMLWYTIQIKYRHEHFHIASLPDGTLYKSDMYPYNIGNTNRAIIVLYFRSDCQSCINEISEISLSEEISTKAQVYCITTEPIEYLKEIETRFWLSQIIFLHDTDKFLFANLNVSSLPATYIFTADRKFIKRFVGFVSVDKIIANIRE